MSARLADAFATEERLPPNGVYILGLKLANYLQTDGGTSLPMMCSIFT